MVVQASDFKPITLEAKPDSKLVLGELIIIVLYHLSREAHHALSAMENMGIMDYMVNSIKMEQNIVLAVTLQTLNSSSRS